MQTVAQRNIRSQPQLDAARRDVEIWSQREGLIALAKPQRMRLAIRLCAWLVLCCSWPLAAADLSDAQKFLDDYARLCDRGSLGSGWLRYEVSDETGASERVELLFREPLFYQRTVSLPQETNERLAWFDGTRHVYVDNGSNAWAVVRPMTDGLRNNAFLFLSRVFGYREGVVKQLSTLSPVTSEQLTDGNSYLFRSKQTNRTLAYETAYVEGGPELPIRITLAATNGAVMAIWEYKDWKERGAGVWLPAYASLKDRFAEESEPLRHPRPTTYVITDAQLDIPVSDVWFIPRIPANARVEDKLCCGNRSAETDHFDAVAGFNGGAGWSVLAALDAAARVVGDVPPQGRPKFEVKGGVGVRVAPTATGPFTVSMVWPQGPAERGGLVAGDIILGVDGRKTDGMSLKDFVAAVAGERGTEVVLLVKVKRTGETKELHLERVDIAVKPE